MQAKFVTMETKHSQQEFENKKNLEALGMTAVTTAAVFLIFFLISWTIPALPVPPVDEGIEVNLGNSDQGFGNIAPQIPGEPAEAQQTNFNPPPTQQASAETQKEVADNNEPDAPAINTSPKPEIKKPVTANNTTVPKRNTQPVVNPTPVPPKPKAVYAGGHNTGTSGNNADSYNGVKNQGIAGGNGDQGKPNGNPNSDNYTGNGGTGTSGISISQGLSGRHPVGNTHFEDSYQYGGTVFVNVTVDENGKVTSAAISQGSPFPDINKIALRRAYQIQFSKGTETQQGIIKIKFENPKG